MFHVDVTRLGFELPPVTCLSRTWMSTSLISVTSCRNHPPLDLCSLIQPTRIRTAGVLHHFSLIPLNLCRVGGFTGSSHHPPRLTFWFSFISRIGPAAPMHQVDVVCCRMNSPCYSRLHVFNDEKEILGRKQPTYARIQSRYLAPSVTGFSCTIRARLPTRGGSSTGLKLQYFKSALTGRAWRKAFNLLAEGVGHLLNQHQFYLKNESMVHHLPSRSKG